MTQMQVNGFRGCCEDAAVLLNCFDIETTAAAVAAGATRIEKEMWSGSEEKEKGQRIKEKETAKDAGSDIRRNRTELKKPRCCIRNGYFCNRYSVCSLKKRGDPNFIQFIYSSQLSDLLVEQRKRASIDSLLLALPVLRNRCKKPSNNMATERQTVL
ncbi:hypothetical protein LSTR_LSTR013328 [Laodelphax striatellus]|uniref:Uncharacterized protein n=1 Tax=Laodelphax striatellus TaxID=195883 RepID=A0A482WHF0_LAOST|nr:hypothetical protein LSTR_LSTR013328 [Laodelphax striatellus]